MGDDEDQNRHYVVLRRIFIVLAVLTAVPVVMWTLTAFVREYVGPPKLPTFRQLATNPTPEPPPGTGTAVAEPARTPTTQAASSQPAATGMEARATLTDAREASVAPALASTNSAPSSNAIAAPVVTPPVATNSNRAPDSEANMPVGTTKLADPPAVITAADDANVDAKMDTKTNDAGSAEPPAAADHAAAEPLPVVQPLTGKIPLPRHRPSELVMVQITAANVPMPRPRPGAAGAADDSDASGTPLNFIQNLFH